MLKRHIQALLIATLLPLSFLQNAQAVIIINEVNIGTSDYFELYNFGASSVDLGGYIANIRDSGFGSFDFTLPSVTIAANSAVVVVAESPQAGEINAGQNIPWFHTRNLSLTLRDAANNIVDFWAHGSALFGAPAGATFSPSPLSLITTNTDATTYQRTAVSNSGLNFFASDWTSAPASRNQPNANQVTFVPEPGMLLLMVLGGLAGLGFRRTRT